MVIDFISEVQVKSRGTTPSSAARPEASSTPSPSRAPTAYAGSAGFYYSNNGQSGLENKDDGTFWVGKQRPTLRLNPANALVAEYVTYPLNDVPRYEPVFDIGGPVVQDRLW